MDISSSFSRSSPLLNTYSSLKAAVAEVQLQEIESLLNKVETVLNKTDKTYVGDNDETQVLKTRIEEVKRNSYDDPVTGVRRGAWGKEHICDLVCGHCIRVASRRVASLCTLECLWEGHHFKACMTYYTLTSKK